MLSIWRLNEPADAQSLCWRTNIRDTPSSHEAMAQRARRVRNRAREAAADVGEAESHSPAPRMEHQPGRRSRVVVDVSGLSPGGSIIDLTSTYTQQVSGFDEEE